MTGLKTTLYFVLILALPSLGISGQKEFIESSTVAAGDAREYATRTGKKILVQETHPAGQSISTIKVTTKGFEVDFFETFEDMDPVSKVMLGDLDQNGFDEIYIVTTAQGSGSYSNILAFASNRDKSLSISA